MNSYSREERNEIGAAIYGALHAMDDSAPWERLPDHRRKWYRDAAVAAIEANEALLERRWREFAKARMVRLERTMAD